MAARLLQGINMEKSQIRWGCRRGMLELDILLCGFFDARFDALTPEQQDDFIALLREADQDLFRWLVGQLEPEEEKLKNMVNLIREYQLQNPGSKTI